jgi:acetyltransferase-like isoleucine patch superfamily enzyme
MTRSTIKEALKAVVRAAALLTVAPLFLLTRLLKAGVGAEPAFQLGSQVLSLAPSLIGSYLRVAYYRLALPRCGADVCIGFGTILNQPTIELGRRVYIGAHCSVGHCVIEDDAVIGSNVDILSGRHQHTFTDLSVPIREQGGRLETIRVGADCWIGNSSVVMANVGEQSVVGAGSVVSRDVPPRSIAAGNPAKVVRAR